MVQSRLRLAAQRPGRKSNKPSTLTATSAAVSAVAGGPPRAITQATQPEAAASSNASQAMAW